MICCKLQPSCWMHKTSRPILRVCSCLSLAVLITTFRIPNQPPICSSFPLRTSLFAQFSPHPVVPFKRFAKNSTSHEARQLPFPLLSLSRSSYHPIHNRLPSKHRDSESRILAANNPSPINLPTPYYSHTWSRRTNDESTHNRWKASPG